MSQAALPVCDTGEIACIPMQDALHGDKHECGYALEELLTRKGIEFPAERVHFRQIALLAAVSVANMTNDNDDRTMLPRRLIPKVCAPHTPSLVLHLASRNP